MTTAVDILHALHAAAAGALAIDLDAAERHADPTSLTRLLPRVLGVMDEAVRAMTLSLDLHEASDAPGASEVADLSFVARLELLHHREQLMGLGMGEEPFHLLVAAAAGRRLVLKGVGVVEREVALFAGLEAQGVASARQDLQSSLRVRAAYARFRRTLAALGSPQEGAVGAHLARAHLEVSRLVESPTFAELRLDDRLHLRRLAARLLEWLAAGGVDFIAGERLWSDLAAFGQLLAQVNLRVELLEHDRDAVAVCLRVLQSATAPGPEEPLPFRVWARLVSLYGRDDQVDALLDAQRRDEPQLWREQLERLRAPLGVPSHL